MAPSALRAALPETSAERVPGGSFAGHAAGTPGVRYAGVPVEQATPGELPLSLDDAVDRGLKRNLQVQLAVENERSVRGQISTVFYYLLPNLRATVYSNAQEINLAALGFKPSSLAAFGFAPGTVQSIVKVNTTDAQLSADQVLFNLPDFYLYAAA